MTDEEKAAEEAAAAAAGGDQPDAKVLADENTKLKADLEEKTNELEGLKNSDKAKNFGKVREQTKEKDQKHEEEKTVLSKQVEDLQSQVTANELNQQSDWYDSLVHLAVGSDDAKKAAVKAEYDLLNMPVKTREEVLARSQKALKLAGFEVKGDTSSMSFGGGRDSAQPDKSFSDTDEGKKSMDFFAPDLADARKQREANKS